MEERLKRIKELKQKIEKLLDLAIRQGASQTEIDQLLDDLNFANDLIRKIQEKMNQKDKED